MTLNELKDYVFISYSSKDQAIADAFCRLLGSHGIDVWLSSQSIRSGSQYATEILRAIRGCSCFLLLLSEDSQSSQWVAKETERAVHYNKPIFPVLLEQLTLNDEFELYISNSQIIQAIPFEESSLPVQRLVQDIQNRIKELYFEGFDFNFADTPVAPDAPESAPDEGMRDPMRTDAPDASDEENRPLTEDDIDFSTTPDALSVDELHALLADPVLSSNYTRMLRQDLGVCRYCGGKFSRFSKICTQCGLKKDY